MDTPKKTSPLAPPWVFVTLILLNLLAGFLGLTSRDGKSIFNFGAVILWSAFRLYVAKRDEADASPSLAS